MIKKPKITQTKRKELLKEKKLAKKLVLEEKKRQIKKDYLTRELLYGRLNRKKLEKSWQKMQMTIKLSVLQIEFQAAVNNIERLLDSKDFQISLLMDELDVAEEQYNMNLRSHVENMDNIFELYHVRLNDLKNEYDDEYQNLSIRANNETNLLKEKIGIENEHLNTMIFRLEQEKKDVNKELKSVYLAKLKEETNKNYDELGLMTMHEEGIFENMWTQFNDILRDYIKSIKERKHQYKALHEHDNYMTNLIRKQRHQLFNIQKILFKLKDQQLSEKEDLDKHVQFKADEKDFFAKTYAKLRRQLDIDWKCDNRQLVRLVINSNNCIKILESQAKHSESVIKIYSLTGKHETQKEKFLPFPKAVPAIRQKQGLLAGESACNLTVKYLEPFWMKCGQGDALRHSINEEREYLKDDNNYLRHYLEKYCACQEEVEEEEKKQKNNLLHKNNFLFINKTVK